MKHTLFVLSSAKTTKKALLKSLLPCYFFFGRNGVEPRSLLTIVLDYAHRCARTINSNSWKKALIYAYLPLGAMVNFDMPNVLDVLDMRVTPYAEVLPITGQAVPAKQQAFIVAESFDEDLQRPLFGGRLTTRYSRWHQGIDIAIKTGTSIKPIKAGKVIAAGWDYGYGLSVVVDHGEGLTSRYAHLSKVLVTMDRQITADTVVGLVGSTGHSTGPHLHLEVALDGKTINPSEYLP